jgi:hypoxanthine phosphoribosyltransferase
MEAVPARKQTLSLSSNFIDKRQKIQYVLSPNVAISSHSIVSGWVTLKRELLISRETIQRRVKELAVHISSDYQGKEPVLIGVLKGVVFFIADLAREIEIPTVMDFIGASSYGTGLNSCGEVRFTKDVDIPLRGKPIILVEDIVDTGLTLSRITHNLEARHPESMRTCALIDKLERRKVPVSVDYWGFRIEEGFIVGYGLDYNEKYRHLPDIYVLR